jgi:hypothetical protein
VECDPCDVLSISRVCRERTCRITVNSRTEEQDTGALQGRSMAVRQATHFESDGPGESLLAEGNGCRFCRLGLE